MFGKIKRLFLKTKVIIIILFVLAIVGWGFMIYFGIRANKAEKLTSSSCLERIEKLNGYAVLLDQSNKLARQNKGLEVLEQNVRALKNGTLLAEWQNVVFGGNQKKDLDSYFDVILDSLIFFSK
ncbi:MAG: hypothetical protein ACOZAL_01265 [Patescibacteria group bacterium]